MDELTGAFIHGPVAMALIDSTGVLSRVNGVFCDLVGHPAEALVGRSLNSLSQVEDLEVGADELACLTDGRGDRFQVEKRFVHAGGRTIWALLSVSVVPDAAGCPTSFIAHIQDISDRQDLARRLAYMADHDALTDLLNRRSLEKALAQHRRTVNRYGGHGAVLLLDLDRFKTVNDRFGHSGGDEVLKGVAAILRDQIRESDTLARLGGDEFAIILPHAAAGHAQVVAADLVDAIGRSYALSGGNEVSITASVGVAQLSEREGCDALAAADAAMYRVKRTGGNGWSADASMDLPAGTTEAGTPAMRMGLMRLVTGRPRVVAALGFAATVFAVRRWTHPFGEQGPAPESA
jgi:diguanylate cyclase (GGDEF)-like protein/PAS domain S-box-containing protein